MSSRTSDVNLLIRARDESSKTLESISGALDRLFGAQEKVAGSAGKTGGGISELAKTIATLDKAYSSLTGNAQTAEQAFARQSSAIAGQREALGALQQQAAAASAALANLNSGNAIVSAGRNQTARLAQLKTVGEEYTRLQGQITKLASTIATQENALGNSTSSLQRIGSTANAVEEAIGRARTQLEAETRALQLNTTAARDNAAVKPRVDAVTGVTKPVAVSDDYRGLIAQIKAEDEARQAEIRTLKAQEAATSSLAAEQLQQQRASAFLAPSGGGKSARDSASVFQAADAEAAKNYAQSAKESAVAEAGLAEAAARLRAQLDPVADVEARLVAEQSKLNDLFRAGKISSTELTGGLALLRGNADKVTNALRGNGTNGKPALFGLKPYELTNLGYQVNDVVTQLASGTSLTQTLAQQGGQILQLFPRVGASVIAGLTSAPVLLFTAAIGTLILGIKEASDQAENLRKINGILTLNADGARYSATAFVDSEKAFKQFGISADEALKVVRIALANGLDPDKITTFGMAAKNLADIMGTDVVSAAGQLSAAFNGGYEGIAKLDQATNVYTASQLNQIRGLFDLGRAQQGVALATEIFSRKIEEAAAKSRGPWKEATEQLSGAWSGFLGAISNSAPIQIAVNNLTDLANAASNAIKKISATGAEALNNEQIDLEQRYSKFLKFDYSKRTTRPYSVAGDTSTAQGQVINQVAQRLNDIIEQRGKLLQQQADLAKKTAATNAATVTENQRKADAALTADAEKRANLEGKITSEKLLQARLAQLRKDAVLDAGKQQPGSSDAARQAYADTVVARERVGLEKQLADYKKQQANEAERQARANNTVEARTKALLIQSEGFRSTAKYDRNAYRVGYGSDTTTAADGTVSRVTSTTTTTVAAATRDLERRIKEFSDTVKRQIGSDRYNAFNTTQQAALNSIAYNYGSLPQRILGAVRTGTSEEIATAVRGLGNDNGGINRSRRNREAAMIETPNLELERSTVELEQDRLDVQKKFNDQIDDENAKRQLGIASLTAEAGLRGEALIGEQRKEAIAEARLSKQQELDRINAERAKKDLNPIEFTPEQRAEIEKTTAAYFDLAHARDVAAAKREAVERPVTDLSAQRDAVGSQIGLRQQAGDDTAALEETYKSLTDQINAARDAQIALYESIIAGGEAAAETNGTTVDALIAQVQAIQNAKDESNQLGTQFLETGRQINQSLASGATQAFDRFAQSVAAGKNVFSSLKDAFLSFAADFLRQIVTMIEQQAIFNALGGSGGSGNGGAGGGIAGAIGGLFGGKSHHVGGIVGSGGTDRAVNPAWFANVHRYHTGGVVGLAPDEVAGVLREGEEVLTRQDPRHRLNGGAGGSQGNVKLVNLFDKEDAIREMLNTRAGEEALLNVVSGNPGAFSAAIGRS